MTKAERASSYNDPCDASMAHNLVAPRESAEAWAARSRTTIRVHGFLQLLQSPPNAITEQKAIGGRMCGEIVSLTAHTTWIRYRHVPA